VISGSASTGLGTLEVENPKVTIGNNGGGNCLPFGSSCTFTASGGKVTLDVEDSSVTGGEPRIKAINEALTSLCGNGTWTATYRVSTPNPMYFSA
jgi:hypothetical protein